MDWVRGERAFAITNEPAGGSPAPTRPRPATIALT
jgi:anti-sigma-K factor RskA